MEQLNAESVAVEIAEVSHTFGDVVAVNDVSIIVEPGEFVTLLGPSGSGKTTLLRIVSGLITPTAGTVLIGDEDVTTMPPEQRNVGLVFQNYALFPHLSVSDNVAYPLKLRQQSKREIDDRVEAVLEMVELLGLKQRKPEQLSGGQQQRVALARAIVFHPNVLLMDEPLGALDKRLREQLQIELRKLQRELDITTIYVTHDQEEAFTMSDRIAVMRQGSVLQMGRPEDIYYHPQDEFTATFVGDLNRLDGEIVEVSSSAAVASMGSLEVSLPGVDLERGSSVMIGVRPERVLIQPSEPMPNTYDATVQMVVFLGGYRRVELVLRDGQQLVASVQGSNVDLREGAVVKVAWYPQDCLAFGVDGKLKRHGSVQLKGQGGSVAAGQARSSDTIGAAATNQSSGSHVL